MVVGMTENLPEPDPRIYPQEPPADKSGLVTEPVGEPVGATGDALARTGSWVGGALVLAVLGGIVLPLVVWGARVLWGLALQ
jgi:hypothetical protein